MTNSNSTNCIVCGKTISHPPAGEPCCSWGCLYRLIAERNPPLGKEVGT